MCKARFSSQTSIKAYLNRLGAEVDMRIQLSSIKLDIKEIYKNIKQGHSSVLIYHVANMGRYNPHKENFFVVFNTLRALRTLTIQ